MKKHPKESLSFDFLKKRVRVSVIVVTLLLSALLLLISYSYAFYTISYEKKNALTLTAGSISYTLTSGSMNERQEVIVGANSMLTFTVNLKSNNEIDSLYQLYYSGTLPSGVTISYKTSVPDGVIEKGATEVIVLAIENTNSSSKTITIGVQGGLLDKPLEQEANTTSIKGLYQAKKPTITLNTTTVTINAGDSYQVMTGVSAKDPYGKDITSKISYSPTSWNNHTIGTTKITYQVTDNYGQSTSSTRSITVNRVYLYQNGNFMTTLTGGWTRKFTTANIANYYDYQSLIDSSSNKLYGMVTTNQRTLKSAGTVNKINLTPYARLVFSYSTSNDYVTNALNVGCFANFDNIDIRGSVVSTYITQSSQNALKTVSFDISAKNSSCYVGAFFMSQPASTTFNVFIQIYNVWLE